MPRRHKKKMPKRGRSRSNSNVSQSSSTVEHRNENNAENAAIMPSSSRSAEVEDKHGDQKKTSADAEQLKVKSVSEKYAVLEIVRRVIQQLKKRDDRTVAIIEKILTLGDDTSAEKALRFLVVADFLNHLEESDAEDIVKLSKLCAKSFLPEQLKKLIVDTASIETSTLIGQGGFGIVYLGKLRKPDGQSTTVAVKTPLAAQHNAMTVEEAKVMAQLDHENVLKILAFQKDVPKIVVEYMEQGNLLQALNKISFSNEELLRILLDVASGMEYIAMKNYVHRDLSMKNIFVDSSRKCKIGDFGLAVFVGDTDGIYEEKEFTLATYNTAPEAKLTRKFSTKSDVWSMGLLIWQLYLTVQYPDDEFFQMATLYDFITFGALLQPRLCRGDLYKYIRLDLLNNDPQKRPDFTAIKDKICQIMALPDSDANNGEGDDPFFNANSIVDLFRGYESSDEYYARLLGDSDSDDD